jgi:hypothetical protein
MTEQMARMFVGETPLAPQRLVARVIGAGWYPFHRTAGLLLGGLEMACWDAAGKYFGQPVPMLFGGALRTSVDSIYYIQAQNDHEAMLQQGRPSAPTALFVVHTPPVRIAALRALASGRPGAPRRGARGPTGTARPSCRRVRRGLRSISRGSYRAILELPDARRSPLLPH